MYKHLMYKHHLMLEFYKNGVFSNQFEFWLSSLEYFFNMVIIPLV